MPTTRLYTSQSHATLGIGLQNIVRFLMNDHGSFVGPGWILIEAYSQAQAAREVPPNSSNLDSLVSATAWHNSTIETGSWVVLESRNANNSNHFQLYIEYDTTSQLNFMLIPFQNFTTGGSAISPPLFPTSSFGNASGTFSVMANSGLPAAGTYSVIADEGMMAILEDCGVTPTAAWMYAGELDSVLLSGSFGDDRAYVLKRTNTQVSWDTTGGTMFSRLSPFDNFTVLTSGGDTQQSISVGGAINLLNDGLGQDILNQSVFPTGLWFNDSNHRHFVGWFRNVYSAHADLLKSGTIATDQGIFAIRSNGASPAQLAFSWNTTSFGSRSLGTFHRPPEMISSSFYSYFIDTYSTGSGGTNTVYVNSVPTGTYDLNRMKIVYPFNRVRRRNANISG